MKIRPVVQVIMDQCDDIQELKKYQKNLHPATIAKIAQEFDHQVSSCES